MEYSLTFRKGMVLYTASSVLILILMEYSLTKMEEKELVSLIGLNPYSNGILPDRCC